MSDTSEREPGKLSLTRPNTGGAGRLELKKTVEVGKVRQSFSHGRSKAVSVEVKKKRTFSADQARRASDAERGRAGLSESEREIRFRVLKDRPATPPPAPVEETPTPAVTAEAPAVETPPAPPPVVEEVITPEERARRAAERELEELRQANAEETRKADEASARRAEEAARLKQEEEARRARERPTRRTPDERQGRPSGRPGEGREPREARDGGRPDRTTGDRPDRGGDRPDRGGPGGDRRPSGPVAPPAAKTGPGVRQPPRPGVATPGPEEETEEGRARRGRGPGGDVKRTPAAPKRPGGGNNDAQRRGGGARISVSQAMDGDALDQERTRSLASVRRARERERQRLRDQEAPAKVVREVIIPETIMVSDLAGRMAERTVDVIKTLMRNGIMATPAQIIDADTAELVVGEFGHKFRRVAESDVELGLEGIADEEGELEPRPPVVTIMGHVDHGKTSLLDALRSTDVAGGEAGGITQHIGAYQVTLGSGDKVTFLDTPGHEAFSAMRARGAKVTDIVILVVAADDSVQPQTIEALNHAKAANVPMIVAINKIDKPGADPQKVKNDLLQYSIVSEDLGGDTQFIEVSALKKINLDGLLEAILLQAEVLELKANPERDADGAVVEAKLDRGRGPVATVLVQRGSLHVGDIVVAGSVWGKVRALVDDKGQQIRFAPPSMPIEVLGLNGTPSAGDEFVVVRTEARAREITEFRERRERTKRVAIAPRSSIDDIFKNLAAGTVSTVPVVIKADVQGSVEAIVASLEKLGTDEVKVAILHAGVGGINESDITLAGASNGFIIGFNVRASAQARTLAERDGTDIRYYSIIYELIDDMKTAMAGKLAPVKRERQIGNAEIREVFNITKVGMVAGCRVLDGIVKRGAGVRLLRDNVVVHEGKLSTLKHFKEEVREVRQGLECGMSFENYENIKVGDVIECFEVEEVARTL